MNTGSVIAQFTVTLTHAVTEPVLVEWFTSDGTAVAGIDYAANRGTVTFAPGQTERNVEILVYGRPIDSPDVTFFVNMLPPLNAILGAPIGEVIIHVDTSGIIPVAQIIVATGPEGPKGDKGDKGDTGDSAYEAWLALGNTGTEQDFIDSLSDNTFDRVDNAISAFDGDLVAVAEFAAVPAHSDPDIGEAMNLQAQKLLNRTEALKYKTDQVMSVRDYITTPINGTTSNQAGIVAAVAAALAAGADLYWPPGTYLSDASIPNFHSVRHIGTGVIKRGSTTFAINPRVGTHRLYVAVSGSDANDGLTLGLPVATTQRAFDILKNYGPILEGNWEVNFTAGQWTSIGQETLSDIKSVNRIVFKGPTAGHPNVPTAIIDGGSVGANYQHGWSFSGVGLLITVQDIFFRNFKGDPSGLSRCGLIFDNGCDGYTNNVHAYDITWGGVYYSRRTQGRHQGGVIDKCRNGIVTDGAKVSLGYGANSLATGPTIKNCTEAAVYWCRGTDGHTDYVNFLDNAVALFVDTNSRTDSVGCDFKRNTVAVRTDNAGFFGDNPYTPCTFNEGTADANATVFDFRANSGPSIDTNPNHEWVRVAYDRTTRTASGTAPAVLATPYTIKAGRMKGAGKSCKIEVVGAYTVTAGSAITVKFGGLTLSLSVPAAGTSVVFKLEVTLMDVQGGYRAFGSIQHNLSNQRMGNSASGFSASADQAISVECALAGAGDSMSIYRTDVSLIG